ncbi:MAG: ComF family protein [Armatimonadetes bacterium]|nr:ComF family protein [Armatimonadota bacterium]
MRFVIFAAPPAVAGCGAAGERGSLPPLREIARLWSEIVDLLYPPRCAICGTDSRLAFCQECLSNIYPIEEPFCRRCNVPFPESVPGPALCSECKRSRTRLIAVRSAGLHAGTLRTAVLKFKFHGERRLAHSLAELMYQTVLAEADRQDGMPVDRIQALVPAVLHPRRRRWRGFDQSVALARALSGLWGIPVLLALRRQRETVPQVGLEPAQRRRNLEGAFVLNPGMRVEGLTVAVIDDVFTTGATLEACASALARAGAVAVYGFTVTRTPPPWHEAAADKSAAAGA